MYKKYLFFLFRKLHTQMQTVVIKLAGELRERRGEMKKWRK